MNKKMQKWVDEINAERISLMNKAFVQKTYLSKHDNERLKFCSNVIKLAYPSVSLEDYKLLDDMEKRHNERKAASDKLMKELGIE